LDIGLLKAFLEVHRTRHFGRAASNLFLSQSAVSARIRQLEEEAGTTLFTRERNNIELTQAGHKFLSYAESIVTTWNSARQAIAEPEGVETTLSVAAVPSIWDIFLQDWLHWIRERFPQVAIAAEAGDTDALQRRLLDGASDLVFLFDPPTLSKLQVQEVVPIQLILVSTDAGADINSALQDNYVLVDWGTSFAITHARLFPDIPAPSLRVGLGRMAYAYLCRRGGSAYLPEPMVAEDLRQGRMTRINDAPCIERSAYVAYTLGNDKRDALDHYLSWFNR